MEGLPHGRLLFPEAAVHLREEATFADLIRMFEIRGRGIRVLSGTVTYNEEGAVWLRLEGHTVNMPNERSASNVRIRSAFCSAHDEGNDPEDQEDREQDVGDVGGCACETAETENGCDEGDDEEYECPV